MAELIAKPVVTLAARAYKHHHRYRRFDALVAVLDPNVVLRADLGGGVTQELRGAAAVGQPSLDLHR